MYIPSYIGRLIKKASWYEEYSNELGYLLTLRKLCHKTHYFSVGLLQDICRKYCSIVKNINL